MTININSSDFQELSRDLPSHFDLTDEKTQDTLEDLAAKIQKKYKDKKSITALHDYVIKHKAEYTPIFHLAVKNALSRIVMIELQIPVHITMNVAMYKENNRMQKKSDHANGEDFINVKARQLNWLVIDTNHTWDLIFIDDGCSENSGGIARDIIKRDNIPNTRVLFLEDGINKKLAGASGLGSTSDSVKGGSIQFGMWTAIQEIKAANHVLAYTDADLSTDLRMSGLLVDQIFNKNKSVAIGSRYLEGSLMDSTDADGMTGERIQNFVKLRNAIRSMLLFPLSKIKDTNCAFKMFTRERAQKMLADVKEKTFAFDIEFLLYNVLLDEHSIGRVPIVWADSNEEATSRHSKTHLEGIKGMCRIYLNYADSLNDSNEQMEKNKRELAEYFSNMEFDHYQKICDAMNPEFWTRLESTGGINVSGIENLIG